MPTYYADSFTQSFEKLGNKEQNLVKILAWDLNNSKPTTGTQFHRVEKSKDPDFWSLRVNSDLRIIVHKQGPKLMICYVDHHDKAYDWARRRRLETHPVTGSVQFVVIPEVEEKVAHTGPKAKRPWAHLSEATLLEQGVPPGWIKTVQQSISNAVNSSENIINYSGNSGQSLTFGEHDLFPQHLLGHLPNFHYIASIAGGRVIKGRLPIITH